jgi:hypothetical protein
MSEIVVLASISSCILLLRCFCPLFLRRTLVIFASWSAKAETCRQWSHGSSWPFSPSWAASRDHHAIGSSTQSLLLQRAPAAPRCAWRWQLRFGHASSSISCHHYHYCPDSFPSPWFQSLQSVRYRAALPWSLALHMFLC